MFDFLHVKANSKEICEANILSFYLKKMLMSAFLLRFKANYLVNMRGYSHFSIWISIALAKIYVFYMAQKPSYLVNTVFNWPFSRE